MALPEPPKVLTVAELAAAGVAKTFHFSDGLVAVHYHLPAGTAIGTHVHPYGHLSVLATGKVRLTADGTSLIVSGPNCLDIRQGMEHEIFAIEDAHWYCIHRHEEDAPTAETIEDALIAAK